MADSNIKPPDLSFVVPAANENRWSDLPVSPLPPRARTATRQSDGFAIEHDQDTQRSVEPLLHLGVCLLVQPT